MMMVIDLEYRSNWVIGGMVRFDAVDGVDGKAS